MSEKILEFRPRENGEFDEIVARFADGMVHVETMSGTSCYVGFYWNDGRVCQWWINSSRKLKYHHETEEPAQGMQLREDSRSEAEAEGLQPGPAKQDAP